MLLDWGRLCKDTLGVEFLLSIRHRSIAKFNIFRLANFLKYHLDQTALSFEARYSK